MLTVHDGQCGLCAHFGEDHANKPVLVSIRTKHRASEKLVDDCGHPKHAVLHLKVSATSGCDGFKPAKVN